MLIGLVLGVLSAITPGLSVSHVARALPGSDSITAYAVGDLLGTAKEVYAPRLSGNEYVTATGLVEEWIPYMEPDGTKGHYVKTWWRVFNPANLTTQIFCLKLLCWVLGSLLGFWYVSKVHPLVTLAVVVASIVMLANNRASYVFALGSIFIGSLLLAIAREAEIAWPIGAIAIGLWGIPNLLYLWCYGAGPATEAPDTGANIQHHPILVCFVAAYLSLNTRLSLYTVSQAMRNSLFVVLGASSLAESFALAASIAGNPTTRTSLAAMLIQANSVPTLANYFWQLSTAILAALILWRVTVRYAPREGSRTLTLVALTLQLLVALLHVPFWYLGLCIAVGLGLDFGCRRYGVHSVVKSFAFTYAHVF